MPFVVSTWVNTQFISMEFLRFWFVATSDESEKKLQNGQNMRHLNQCWTVAKEP